MSGADDIVSASAASSETNAATLPYRGLIVALQRLGMAGSATLLFASVVIAPAQHEILGGAVGVNGVWIYSLALAFFTAQHTWLATAGLRPTRVAAPRTDRWARFAFLCVFLVFVNVFVTSARGLFFWGVVVNNDEPQYYSYLHSWVFDRDVHFENELKAIPGAWELMERAHPERPEYNVAPIGTAIVWLPFYLGAHAVLTAARAAGVDVVADGLSAPYAFACAFGSNVFALIGVVLIHATLRKWFSPVAALMASLLVWVASPLPWYQTDQPWMSHAASFMAASTVFWLWAQRDNRTPRGWIVLGAAIGLAMLVRPTHAVLTLLLSAEIGQAAFTRRLDRSLVVGAIACAAMIALMYIPQILVWAVRYDWLEQGINTPPGSPMAWTNPSIVPVLFSAFHGLFAWHPVLALGFAGLIPFRRRSAFAAVSLALLLASYVYANAAIESWHGIGSFGMRRFVGVLPFMAPGIAAMGVAAVKFSHKRPWVPAGIVVLLLAVYNATLVIQMRTGWTPFARPVSFQQIWTASAAIFHETFGNPFSYPANLVFAFQHGVSPAQYDVAAVAPETVDVEARGVALRPYLGRGWQTQYTLAFRQGAYAADQYRAELFLPLRRERAYDLNLTFSLPTRMTDAQQVQFHFNGHRLGDAHLKPGGTTELALVLPAEAVADGLNVLALDFRDRIAIPRGGGADGEGRGLYVATRRPFYVAALLSRLKISTKETNAAAAAKPPDQ